MVATSDCSAFSVAVGAGTGPSPPVAACLSFRVDPVLEVLPGVMFVTSACAAMRHYTAALHGAFADARQAVRLSHLPLPSSYLPG